MKRWLLTALLFTALGLPAHADTVLGTWLSPRDHKGQVGHLQLANCGATICGTLVRVYDRSGRSISTPNVGKRLVWGMRPSGSNAYKGEVYVPLMKGNFPAEMKVSGNRMTVRGCTGLGICKAQTWTRVN